LNSQKFKHKVFIAGNHEIALHTKKFISLGYRRVQRVDKVFGSSVNPSEYSYECRDIAKKCGSVSI
jgi:hypothetical protein